MNIRKVEDEKKARADNIRKQMKQQWIPKSTKETSSNHGREVTQEVSDSIIANEVFKGELELYSQGIS